DVGPNTTFQYGDSNHPQLPTRLTDGKGVHTDFTYAASPRTGLPLTRTDAVGTALERTTTWQYGDASFPAFPTRIEVPSTDSGTRRSDLVYDGDGNPIQRTEIGREA